jgi:tripartite-type tricarboxylate transporter receptor subunit TctC
VLYKGSAPTEFAVLQGEVQVTILTPIASANHINAGRLKALGVTSAKRISLLPAVPTIAESGVAGYDFQIWHGMFAPRGISDKLVHRLNRDVQAILAAPENRNKAALQGFEVMRYTPEEFAVFVKSETDKYRKIIKEAGIPQE